MTSTYLTNARAFLSSARTNYRLLILCLLLVGVTLAFNQRADSTNPGNEVTVRAAGRGKPYLNLRDGREMKAIYRGDSGAAAALQNGAARARALASADFDRNGTPDVVAGYDFNGAGIIALRHARPE